MPKELTDEQAAKNAIKRKALEEKVRLRHAARQTPEIKDEDMIGKKFNSWIVISKVTGFDLWTCRCDCGVERVVGGRSLRYGCSKSCGECGILYFSGCQRN